MTAPLHIGRAQFILWLESPQNPGGTLSGCSLLIKFSGKSDVSKSKCGICRNYRLLNKFGCRASSVTSH
ncbi:MAG: hypothetical protein KDA69_09310, partial [Planctomycetaceae bacterium]|nr:hypothetical protein [Planctomycetaceae bacterium]